MLNLIRAEWFKLVRRPLVWVLLLVFLVLMVLQLATEFMVVGLQEGIFSGGAHLSLSGVLTEAQLTQFHLHMRLPGIWGSVLSQVNGVGGICAIVLAAGSFGSEYSWGTLRMHLARQPQRGHYLVAKLVALVLVLAAGTVIALGFGTLLALLFGGQLGNIGTVSAHDLVNIPLGILRALYVLLPYTLATIACAVVGRSVVAGAAGGFVFLLVDAGLGALSLLTSFGGMIAFVLNLIVQPNINTMIVLNSRSFGLDQSALSRSMDLTTLPSPWQATLIIAVYNVFFFATAYRFLLRRDITGAA